LRPPGQVESFPDREPAAGFRRARDVVARERRPGLLDELAAGRSAVSGLPSTASVAASPISESPTPRTLATSV
jgi:hypothetical protein